MGLSGIPEREREREREFNKLRFGYQSQAISVSGQRTHNKYNAKCLLLQMHVVGNFAIRIRYSSLQMVL
jgi:hypothetical protein